MASNSPATSKSALAGAPTCATVVNVRFVAALTVIIVIGGIAAFLWHRRQLTRLAAVFLERAEQQEQSENWRAAVQSTQQYLRIRPNDRDARVRLASAFGASAQSAGEMEQAIRHYDQAIGLASGKARLELQRGQADVFLRLNRFVPAIEQADAVLEAFPGDKDALRIKAMGMSLQFGRQGSAPASEVIRSLDAAREVNPNHVDLAVVSAEFLRRHANDPQSADQIMAAVIDRLPKDASALLAVYEYRRRHQAVGADEILDKALAIGADDANVQFRGGERAAELAKEARRQGDEALANSHYKSSVSRFERAIELVPWDRRSYVGAASAHASAEQLDSAVEKLELGLRVVGDNDVQLLLMLAGLQINQNQLQAASETLVKTNEAINALAARVRPSAATEMRRFYDHVKAEWHLAKGERNQALVLYQRVARGPSSGEGELASAGLQQQALSRIGELLRQLNQWDQVAAVQDQLVALNPTNPQTRFAAALAWSRANQPEAAIRRLNDLLRLDSAVGSDWKGAAKVALSRELYRVNGTRPEGERNWREVDAAISDARDEVPASWQLDLLEADLALTAGARPSLTTEEQRRARALELLRAMEPQHDADVDVLAKLVIGYERLGASADSDRVLKVIESQSKSPVVKSLIRAELAQLRQDVASARNALESGLLSAPPEAKPELALRLAQVEASAGDLKAASGTLDKYCREFPRNAALATALFELRLEDPDENAEPGQDLLFLEDHLKKTYVDTATWKYYRARRLLKEAAKDKNARLLEVERLQSEIEGERSNWSAPHLLQALICRQTDRHVAAIDALKRAIILGDRRPQVFAMLIDSLYREQRFAEASEHLAQMGQLVALSEGLSSLAISVAVETGQHDQAIAYARRRVAESPQDALSQVWLGQALLLAERTEEAKAAFEAAIALAPSDLRAWNGLFVLFVRTGDMDSARQTLLSMVTKTELKASEREYILAQGFEVLGDLQISEAHYTKAAAADPKNIDIRMRLAGMLERTNPPKAIPVLRDLSDESDEARRRLASLLAAVGGDENWKEALQLLGSGGGGDRRARAILLARQGDEANRTMARELFEEIVADPSVARTDDRLLLGRLYELEGKDLLARDQFRFVASQADAKSMHVAAFVEFLLRQRQWDDAATWIAQLETFSPNPFELLALRVRLLDGQEKDGQIAALIDEYVEAAQLANAEPAKRVETLSQAVQLCTSVEQYVAAEKYLRRLMEDSPQAFSALVVMMARQGRTLEAVQMCVEQYASSPTELNAQNVAIVLMADPSSKEANDAADSVLTSAVDTFGNQVPLLNTIGAVRHLQGRFDAAEKIYRLALTAEPGNVLTLNNLATLLAENPAKLDQAMRLVDEGLKQSPNSAGLKDTRAMILYYQGKFDESRKLLEDVVGSGATDARYRFHLALVQWRLGAFEEARRELANAEADRLHSHVMSVAEKTLLRDLKAALSSEG